MKPQGITSEPKAQGYQPSIYFAKIHKPNNQDRPIINGISSVTEKIAAYED